LKNQPLTRGQEASSLMFSKRNLVFFALLVFALLITACGSSQNDALNEAKSNAANRSYYVPQNDVEARNYNWRLQIADDPTLILWCTYFSPNSSVKPITVPIIGKLTSGGKRPFKNDSSSYENPDAQGMYGSSGEYRYGFGPQGKYEYYDFYQNTMCTTMPLVYQAELTVVVSEKDPTLMAASMQAKELLAQGDTAGAQAVIDNAIRAIQQ